MTLEPRPTTLPANPEPDPYDAFQQATKDDLIIPARKLVQGVSRKADTSKAGQFWDEVTDRYKAEMLVSLISMKRTRTLFAEGFENAPLCSSEDAVRPREVTQVDGEPTGPMCEGCHLSQWGTGKNGEGQACQFSYLLLCYDLDDSEMFLLRVGGASRGAWKQYLTKGQRAGTAAYSVGTVISSERKTFSKGVAHVLTFSGGTLLPEDTVDFLREKAMAYQTVVMEREIEEIPEDVPFN